MVLYSAAGVVGASSSNCSGVFPNGRTSTVLWDGVEQEIYHYSATLEYPYTIGCFRGSPVTAPRRN